MSAIQINGCTPDGTTRLYYSSKTQGKKSQRQTGTQREEEYMVGGEFGFDMSMDPAPASCPTNKIISFLYLTP